MAVESLDLIMAAFERQIGNGILGNYFLHAVSFQVNDKTKFNKFRKSLSIPFICESLPPPKLKSPPSELNLRRRNSIAAACTQSAAVGTQSPSTVLNLRRLHLIAVVGTQSPSPVLNLRRRSSISTAWTQSPPIELVSKFRGLKEGAIVADNQYCPLMDRPRKHPHGTMIGGDIDEVVVGGDIDEVVAALGGTHNAASSSRSTQSLSQVNEQDLEQSRGSTTRTPAPLMNLLPDPHKPSIGVSHHQIETWVAVMARRSKHALDFTPNYDKLGMFDVWGFAEELGYTDRNSVRFCLKTGKKINTGNVQSQVESSGMIDGNDGDEELDPVEPEYWDDGEEEANDSDDSDFYDSDYDLEEHDILFEMNVDPGVEYVGSEDKDKGKRVSGEGVDGGYVTEDVYARMQFEKGDADCAESGDELDSLCASDEEPKMKFPKFNSRSESKNPDLQLGLVFDSKKQAKFAIQSHCLRRGMEVNFQKNDNVRLRATCKKNGCAWKVHVSLMNGERSWQIKTYNPNHTNSYWNYNKISFRSGWIGKTFVKKFKSNPNLGTEEFREEICTTLKANVSRTQAYRAKKALKMIDGSVEDQFKMIRNYCHELKRVDDKATVILKLTEDGEGSRFQRLYICFSALRDRFKQACRSVIGVDDCFLKGQSGGQLLTVVRLDPNNNIFPISYAIVERETKDSWMWFLNLLDGDLGISENQFNWTFMSDKQKGLIPAFDTLFPDSENRFCVRHLHSNMKKDGFSGMAVKNALRAAARATRIEEFGRRMGELKEIDELAYDWLVKKPPNQWSWSHFNPFPKCDILLNNMCECFNALILDARGKHIIPMFESIRTILMLRIQLNREKAGKWESAICPKIRDLLIKNMKQAGECIPMRRWELTGIPCSQAISAICCRNENPKIYVHKVYTVDAYKKCYEKAVPPVNGPELWPLSQLEPPLPPKYKKVVDLGRPQRLRRRELDEPPLGLGQGQGNAQTQESTADVPVAAEASTTSQSINNQNLGKNRQKLQV
ncbi:hypothetical protein BUALT_Bualt17G0058600 [Buddleja alternifolia]|uniref:Transposase n=1 Tax=Buddleja alternifolia TaxID=168488 RepID=A0AAV6WCU0_9LAMI|nr:hypothetical protein BUALT_Bualt17G0058600 [Buddleja alternifolia]